MAVKSEFFHHPGATGLLVFFHGWGMDPASAADWELPETDLLVVYDYTEPPGEPPALPAACRRCAVVAWSLGVWCAAASGWCSLLPPGPRIAVNGTLAPISADEGIAPAVFHGTLLHWNDPRAREKFRLRISGSTAPDSARSPESQQRELAALETRIVAAPPPDNPFTAVFCSRRDRIFPFAAQLRSWRLRAPAAPPLERDWLHDPFRQTESRREILHHALD